MFVKMMRWEGGCTLHGKDAERVAPSCRRLGEGRLRCTAKPPKLWRHALAIVRVP